MAYAEQHEYPALQRRTLSPDHQSGRRSCSGRGYPVFPLQQHGDRPADPKGSADQLRLPPGYGGLQPGRVHHCFHSNRPDSPRHAGWPAEHLQGVISLGIVLATILGTFIGVMRLSTNFLVSKIRPGLYQRLSQYTSLAAVNLLLPGDIPKTAAGTGSHRPLRPRLSCLHRQSRLILPLGHTDGILVYLPLDSARQVLQLGAPCCVPPETTRESAPDACL